MTRDEMKAAVELAKSDATLEGEDLDIFNGFGLPDFNPIHVTIRAVAALIRWQAQQFNGQFDAEALNEIAERGRRRFLIISNS